MATVCIDPGLKNVGYCVFDKEHVMVMCGCKDIKKKDKMKNEEILAETTKAFTSIFANHDVVQVYIERQYSRGPMNNQKIFMVAAAIGTMAHLAGAKVEFRNSKMKFKKGLSYSQKKQKAVQIAVALMLTSEKEHFGRVAKDQQNHVADAFLLYRQPVEGATKKSIKLNI